MSTPLVTDPQWLLLLLHLPLLKADLRPLTLGPLRAWTTAANLVLGGIRTTEDAILTHVLGQVRRAACEQAAPRFLSTWTPSGTWRT